MSRQSIDERSKRQGFAVGGFFFLFLPTTTYGRATRRLSILRREPAICSGANAPNLSRDSIHSVDPRRQCRTNRNGPLDASDNFSPVADFQYGPPLTRNRSPGLRVTRWLTRNSSAYSIVFRDAAILLPAPDLDVETLGRRLEVLEKCRTQPAFLLQVFAEVDVPVVLLTQPFHGCLISDEWLV